MKWFHKHKPVKHGMLPCNLVDDDGEFVRVFTAAELYECNCGVRSVKYFLSSGYEVEAKYTAYGIQEKALEWLQNRPLRKDNVVKLRIVK